MNREESIGCHHHTEIQRGGRVTIPIAVRKQLGLAIGDPVVFDVSENDIRLLSHEQAVKEAQDMLKAYLPDNISLVDELIKERRAEAAREEAIYQQPITPNE